MKDTSPNPSQPQTQHEEATIHSVAQEAGDAAAKADNPGKTAPDAESSFERATNVVPSETGHAELVGSIRKAGEKHGSQANQSSSSPPPQAEGQEPSVPDRDRRGVAELSADRGVGCPGKVLRRT